MAELALIAGGLGGALGATGAAGAGAAAAAGGATAGGLALGGLGTAALTAGLGSAAAAGTSLALSGKAAKSAVPVLNPLAASPFEKSPAILAETERQLGELSGRGRSSTILSKKKKKTDDSVLGDVDGSDAAPAYTNTALG